MLESTAGMPYYVNIYEKEGLQVEQSTGGKSDEISTQYISEPDEHIRFLRKNTSTNFNYSEENYILGFLTMTPMTKIKATLGIFRGYT